MLKLGKALLCKRSLSINANKNFDLLFKPEKFLYAIN